MTLKLKTIHFFVNYINDNNYLITFITNITSFNTLTSILLYIYTLL